MNTLLTYLQEPVVLALLAAGLPLLTFLELTFFGKPGKGTVTAIGYTWLSFLLSVYTFVLVWNRGESEAGLTWFVVGDVRFTAGIMLNNLSVLMLALISLISLLVHIFSTAYMENEPSLHRYWSYLGLFCFSMMALVIVSNLLLVYFCWELVGVSSYLLIGFWTTKEAAATAAKKAFIMNRIGDLGFLAGLVILYTQFHTLDISELLGAMNRFGHALLVGDQWISGVNQLPASWLTVAGLGLFLGAMAKSAQFPLHTWLPDAMEGPTPVSSLIHAATMVAAGVFLLVRVFPVFTPEVREVIALVGGFTAFFAATCALVQFDIKKILAWSTISQLGLMMLAIGTGATAQAMFHLVAHAFFKCLLFLGAGSVIHAMNHRNELAGDNLDPQDIRNMGGLRKFMPITCTVMLVAAAALTGLPFTSGYLSKDSILLHVFSVSEQSSELMLLLPFLAFTASLMTAFYSARLVFSVFFGESRNIGDARGLHDPGPRMKWPMVVLSLGCFYPLFTGRILRFDGSWIIQGLAGSSSAEEGLHWVPVALTVGSVLVIAFTWLVYVKRRAESEPRLRTIGDFLFQGWRIDALYQTAIVRPVLKLAVLPGMLDRYLLDGLLHTVARTGVFVSDIASWFDRYVVDAFVNQVGAVSRRIGAMARGTQSGRIQHYLAFALAVLLFFFIISYFSG